jgi:predicted GNAT family acetyltransferase
MNDIKKFDGNGKLIAEASIVEIDDKIVNITRVFVDESLRGQGVADSVMREACDAIRSEGKKARAACPYARKWFEKHPEIRDILAG